MRKKNVFTARAVTYILALGMAFSMPGTAMAAGYGPGAYGPGTAPLSLEDGFSEYQWGLYNDGSLVVDRASISTETYMAMYQSFKDWMDGGGIGVPVRRLRPEDIIHTKLQSVAGVDMNVLEAWNFYLSEKAQKDQSFRDVTVALIDTGMDTAHAELADALWVNADEIPGDGIDNDGNGYIDDINGYNFYDHNNVIRTNMVSDIHATHGAGTIAAKRGNGGMVGLTDNTHVKIMVLKALDSDGGGTEESVTEAIRYAEANGADICNLSLGGARDFPELAKAIAESSMLFVISSGNGDKTGVGYNIDQKPVYPAALPYDNIISVANVTFSGALDQSSNYGATSVDIAAPGTYVFSSVPGNRFDFLTGTSMAAPMVTGVCAMVYSYRTDLDLAGVRTAVLASARRIEALNGLVACGGIPDMYAAMTYGMQPAG